ncbi:MAG: DUF4375 domain-containing protein [Erysipelotrichaceae bacterium]|nr:DUF4375 domain-containing protein [Erysipelotrichaceae bacterium]
MDTSYIIVWVIAIILFGFLGFFLIRRLRSNRSDQREEAMQLAIKQEDYKFLKPGILDECPEHDILTAVLFHCMRKEEEDFDNDTNTFNESETIIYSIYQLCQSIDGKHGNLHSFFISPSTKQYIDIIVEAFEKVNALDLADLMAAAKYFSQIMEDENYVEDPVKEEEIMGIYANYNYSDFTNEFATLVSTTNLQDKLVAYIMEHKEDFYDYDHDFSADEIEDIDDEDNDNNEEITE